MNVKTEQEMLQGLLKSSRSMLEYQILAQSTMEPFVKAQLKNQRYYPLEARLQEKRSKSVRTKAPKQGFNKSSLAGLDSFDDDDFEVEVIKEPFVHPFDMDRHKVSIKHWKNARCYDTDIEDGWWVQNHVARGAYTQWVRNVRTLQGWEQFRRPVVERTKEERDNNGDICIVKRLVFPKVPGLPYYDDVILSTYYPKNQSRSQKSAVTQTPSPVQDGDNDDLNAKMFTKKMGQVICKLRSELNLTQKELGKKINVDAHTIRDIEAGDKILYNPEDAMVKQLAKALGLKGIKWFE